MHLIGEMIVKVRILCVKIDDLDKFDSSERSLDECIQSSVIRTQSIDIIKASYSNGCQLVNIEILSK